MNNKEIIAITIGDIEGIGIEILLKIWNLKKNKLILFSNIKLLKLYLKKKQIKIKVVEINKNINFLHKLEFNKYFYVYNYMAKNNIENSYKSLIYSYKYIKNKTFIGVLTLPLNKEKIIKNIDKNFIGQTELFQKLDNKKISNMIFLYKNLRIVTLTTHIKLSQVIKELNKKNLIFNKILNLYKNSNRDFLIKNPKIVISGINPHASENNNIGNDEKKLIYPVIKKLNYLDINIEGPKSADSILKLNKYVNKNN